MGVSACSRVIMKTALALVVAMFLVSSGSAHGHRNKNRGGKRDECGLQRYTVSEKAYKQECHDVYETQCATTYVNKCSTVTEVTIKYDQVCATSYVENCATVTEVIKECHTASLYRGDLVAKAPYGHGYGHYTAPIKNCVEVPVHNNVCTKEPVESCSKSPRKVCRNVAVSVPRTVARRVCYG